MTLEEKIDALIKYFENNNEIKNANNIRNMYACIKEKESEIDTLYSIRGGRDIIADAQVSLYEDELKKKRDNVECLFRSIFNNE